MKAPPLFVPQANSVYRLWEDYKVRTHLDRIVPRPLSTTRALSLMEQFAAFLLNMDEHAVEADEIFHVLVSTTAY